ncbi:MerR family transcriptional regulator [Massilia niastensis]|uniref:MerR family transcriptional regulator n=1 Tax=Massilia niastensis TaxID=544911 RepID=UPI0003A6A1B3|nr:MerR family transcriptional regulator [Massilia niastensis]
MVSISVVSGETGIAKEVLRKWEDRYGFPMPDRDDAGNRMYSVEQVSRIKLIKLLLDAGLRPGMVVPLDEAQLHELIKKKRTPVVTGAGEEGRQLIDLLLKRDPNQLRENLRSALTRLGLEGFVLNLLPRLNNEVGNAWAAGTIEIHDEHLYTETVQALIREALPHALNPLGWPRILLTTVPGELHTLGTLMVEAALTVSGARCISLGAQSPLPEIASAAKAYGTHIVGLSFSASFPKKNISPMLRQLRLQLEHGIQLWVGGAGVVGLDKVPRGVRIFSTLEEASNAMQEGRQRHAFAPGCPASDASSAPAPPHR